MASPSASVLFVTGTFASTASRTHVRDDRETPLLVARDGATSAADFRIRSIADTCDRLARRANQFLRSAGPVKKVKTAASWAAAGASPDPGPPPANEAIVASRLGGKRIRQ